MPSSPRILIVEDQPALAAMVQQWVQEQGYQSETAGDGITALKMILAAPCDLLLLDLQIPALHGVELLRKLRASKKTATLPVVVMSGVYKGERYRRALQELGVSAFLEKPFTPVQLRSALTTALAQQVVAAHPAASGFDRHLTQAFLRSLSGELHLNDGQISRQLLLINGVPVSLRPGFIHRDFGDYLLSQGVITPQEYDYYAQAGAFRHQTLVQMGCLPYSELLEEKFAYLTLELLAGFSSPPLTAVFHPLTLPADLQIISVNLAEIILQGERSLLTAERGGAYFTRIKDRYLARRPDYYRYINSLRLTDAECAFLPLLDGSRRAAETTQGKAELIPLLYLLHSFGMISCTETATTAAPEPPWPLRSLFNTIAAEESGKTVEWGEMESFADLLDKSSGEELPPVEGASTPVTAPPAAPPEGADNAVHATFTRLQGKNYYEVLGLTPENFSFNKLKESYFAISKEFGPDLLMRLGGEEANQAETILSMVANAYETLSDVVKKEKYDQLLGSEKIGLGHKGDERFRAEVQAQSGKVFIEMEEWDNAEKTLKDACTIEPNNGDTLAHLAWAIYRNPQYAASRPTLDRAKQMLNRAITMERTAPAFAFKGWILLDGGQEALAEGEFNKALKLDARNTLARKGLRRVQEKREQEKKGIFGRMFGG